MIVDGTKSLEVPPNALLFSAGENSMLSNIDTENTIKSISWWLDNLESRNELLPNFPLEPVKISMITIMLNNSFEWVDMYFLQLLGTAMGTLPAVMWATLQFAYHKVHWLITVHRVYIFSFKRFINNTIGVQTGNTTTNWQSFCDDVTNFGILTWDIKGNTPSRAVDFLDLALTIKN